MIRSRFVLIRVFWIAVVLCAVSGCGNEKRAEELRVAELELEERGKTLSSWADELESQEANLTKREAAVIDVLAEVRRKQVDLEKREVDFEKREADFEKREAGFEKIRLELEERHKEAMRGTAPAIVGKYAVVVDIDTGVTLFEKNADSKTAVASTQKLMTGLLVTEAGGLDDLVTVEDVDTKVEPTKLYIKPGEKYARKDLLRALLVRSGNDLALCLARDNAGSKTEFAAKMNEKAKALGMQNSNFINPHGLTEKGQYSTARDMAKLAMAAYSEPVIREFIKTEKTTFVMADGTEKTLTNTNRVLRDFECCDGMKTGYTVASGYCLVSSGCRNGLRRIVVVLGSNGRSVWNDSRKLLEWALRA